MNERKRIGIITFHNAHNNGAVLQCYALMSFLTQIGYNVAIIDYKAKALNYYHWFRWSRFKPWHPRYFLKNIFFLPRRIIRYYSFTNFVRKNLHLVSVEKWLRGGENFDTIVVGSDQLWNINNSFGMYDYFYWGKFKEKINSKIVSYAVSMGGAWKNVDWKTISVFLKNFNAISVREEYLEQLIESRCFCKVDTVLDPTLLISNDFWKSKLNRKKRKRPYLFFYQARNNEKAFLYAKKVAKKKSLDFIVMSADIASHNSICTIGANPFDFLSFIDDADFVITSSFHGTVFSLQYRKNFISLKLGDGDDGRIENILKMYGLLERFSDLNKIPEDTFIDYNRVEKNAEEIRKFSTNWLYANL